MAGYKERYKVQNMDNGRIYTYTAQSHVGAKRLFMADKAPDKGTPIKVWVMGEPNTKKKMRV